MKAAIYEYVHVYLPPDKEHRDSEPLSCEQPRGMQFSSVRTHLQPHHPFCSSPSPTPVCF